MQKKVTILGAGIVGVCCALSLQESGYSVTLIDRGSPGGATSYGNAGVISPWSCVPMCLPGTFRQLPSWLVDTEGPVAFRWRDLAVTLPWVMRFLSNTKIDRVEKIADAMSMLMRDNVGEYQRYLYNTDHSNLVRESLHVNAYRGDAKPTLDDLAYRLRRQRGAVVEIVKGHDLRSLEPSLSDEFHTGVIVAGQGRAVDPGRLCKVLCEKAQAQGAELLQANVERLTPLAGGGAMLECADQRIESSILVLCAGVWSADLLQPLKVRLPLISERGYHMEFRDPGITINNSVLDVTGKFIASSMENGVRAAGTSEFAHHSAPPDYKRAELLKAQTRRLFPDLSTDQPSRWMGVRPSFPDCLPVIGNIPGYRGIVAAFGHSHWGLGMAPGSGRLVAQILQGTATDADYEMLSPARFL